MYRDGPGSCSRIIPYLKLTQKGEKQHLFTQTGYKDLTTHRQKLLFPCSSRIGRSTIDKCFYKGQMYSVLSHADRKKTCSNFTLLSFFQMYSINFYFFSFFFSPGSSIKMVSATRNAWSSDLLFTVMQCSLSLLL